MGTTNDGVIVSVCFLPAEVKHAVIILQLSQSLYAAVVIYIIHLIIYIKALTDDFVSR